MSRVAACWCRSSTMAAAADGSVHFWRWRWAAASIACSGLRKKWAEESAHHQVVLKSLCDEFGTLAEQLKLKEREHDDSASCAGEVQALKREILSLHEENATLLQQFDAQSAHHDQIAASLKERAARQEELRLQLHAASPPQRSPVRDKPRASPHDAVSAQRRSIGPPEPALQAAMRRHAGLVRAVFELHAELMPQLKQSADEAASALQHPPAILPHRRGAVRVFRHFAVLCDGQLLLGLDQFAWCLATAACMHNMNANAQIMNGVSDAEALVMLLLRISDGAPHSVIRGVLNEVAQIRERTDRGRTMMMGSGRRLNYERSTLNGGSLPIKRASNATRDAYRLPSSPVRPSPERPRNDDAIPVTPRVDSGNIEKRAKRTARGTFAARNGIDNAPAVRQTPVVRGIESKFNDCGAEDSENVLHKIFRQYVIFTGGRLTSSKALRLCRDCHVLDNDLDPTAVDICFTAVSSGTRRKNAKGLDFDEPVVLIPFCGFLSEIGKRRFLEDSPSGAFRQMRDHIIQYAPPAPSSSQQHQIKRSARGQAYVTDTPKTPAMSSKLNYADYGGRATSERARYRSARRAKSTTKTESKSQQRRRWRDESAPTLMREHNPLSSRGQTPRYMHSAGASLKKSQRTGTSMISQEAARLQRIMHEGGGIKW